MRKLTEKTGYKYGSADHDKLVVDAFPWAVDALAAAHASATIKQAERNLFASFHFTRQFEFVLLSEKGGRRPVFAVLNERLHEHLSALGAPLSTVFNEQELLTTVGTYRPKDRFPKSQQRQDCPGGVPTPPWDFAVWGTEWVYIHVLRLLATAVDTQFIADVESWIGHDLLVDGKTSHNGIKGFERMANKMVSKDDHRHSPRPRPAQNVDINRTLATFAIGVNMKEGLQKLHERAGGFVKFKNQMSTPDMSKFFHLRLCMVSILYQHPTLRTVEDFAQDAGVQQLWTKYAKQRPPASVPRGRWRSQIQRALTWLRSSSAADQPVRMVCEVQCLLQAYKEVRHSMHEIYKVSFLFFFCG